MSEQKLNNEQQVEKPTKEGSSVAHVKDLDSIREELASKDKLQNEGKYNPEELKKLYLNGKLTADQLAHELKVYNSVVADTLIREGKHSQVQVAQFKETRLADYGDQKKSNESLSGTKLKDEKQDISKGKPKSLREAKSQSKDADDEGKKAKAEKEIKRVKDTEQRNLNNQIQVFTTQQKEQKNSHVWREIKKQEEEKLAEEMEKQELDPGESQQIGDRTKASLKSQSKAVRADKLEKEKSGGARGEGR